jgi:hypothetical protein
MGWADPRGSAATSAAVRLAFDDPASAKSRSDESSQHSSSRGARRGLRSNKLVVAGAAGSVLVVLVVVTVLASLGGGDDKSGEPAAADPTVSEDRPSTSAGPSTSPTPTVDPVAAVAAGEPTGIWRLVRQPTTDTWRNGTVHPSTDKPVRTRWTFTSDGCAADQCTGSIDSSSGSSFTYTWDGALAIAGFSLVDTFPKDACTDDVTGDALPIDESASIITFTYDIGPMTGSATELTAKESTAVSYKFFGTCHPNPDDLMSFEIDRTLTQLSG